MSRDKIIKELDLEYKLKDHLWNALIISIGGSIGISLNPDSLYKKILLAVGILFSIVFFFAYFRRDDRINNLINQLED